MFISFLYPFRLRGRRAPFLWVAYKQMGDLGADRVAFIASEDYFVDPERYRMDGRFECHATVNPELAFRVPLADTVDGFRRTAVPESIYRRLKETHVSDALVWLHLIKNEDAELTDWICDQVADLCPAQPCEGILTWCNYASLTDAGRRLGLPVMHCELGPLRDPWYLPLGYLDFRGVNGGTEAERRQGSSPVLDSCFSDIDSIHRFFSRQDLAAFPSMPDAGLGIPLQVEDDSNVLAYGRGFDMYRLLQYACEAYGEEEILVRPHPGAHLTPKPGFRIDRSKTSAAFVGRCSKILTLSSSVAVEAMLQGKPVTILGESPARHLAGSRIETARVATLDEIEFLLLNYFVPYDLLFDTEYLRWRLTNPPECAIRERHLKTLRNARVRLCG